MMAGNAHLDEMIRKLAGMSPPDRAYVLARLGEGEAGVLEPHLKRLEVRSMSPELQSIVADCADGQTPPMLTPRAAGALRMAMASEPPIVAVLEPGTGTGQLSLRNRLNAWLDKR